MTSSNFRYLVLTVLLSFSFGCADDPNKVTPPGATCPIIQSVSETEMATSIWLSTRGDEIAQSFKVFETMSVKLIKLRLLREGSPNGTITVSIQNAQTREDPAALALPDNTDLASATMTVVTNAETKTIGTDPDFYLFTFEKTIELEAGKTFWIRIKATYPAGADADVVKVSASDLNPYANGKLISELLAPNSWSETEFGANRDAVFSVCTQ